MEPITFYLYKFTLCLTILLLYSSAPAEQHLMRKSSHNSGDGYYKQFKRQAGDDFGKICQCNGSAMTQAQQSTDEAIGTLSNDVGTVVESVRKMQWGPLQEQQLRIFDLSAKMRACEAAILGLDAKLMELAANQESLLKEATRIELTLRHEEPLPKRRLGKKKLRK